MKKQLLLTFNRVAESAVGGEKCANTPPTWAKGASYRVIAVIFMFCMLGIGSMWADDLSVTEKFSNIGVLEGANDEAADYNGDLCQWNIRANRRPQDEMTVDNIAHQQCWWLNRSNVNKDGSFLKTKNFEGGIKSVKFRCAQFSNNEDNNTLILSFSVGEESHNYTVIGSPIALAGGEVNSFSFAINNGQLEIKNVSTGTGTSPATRRILLHSVTITPYLLYKHKKVIIDLSQSGYKNESIIDNTEGEGTISYSSSNESVATVTTSGVIEPKAVGKTTITATWNEITTTSYELIVANTAVETFETTDGSVTNTYVTSVTTKECQQTSWTFFSGGILKNLGNMGEDNFAAIIRAKKSTESVYPYIESSTIEGGIRDLQFTWNSNGNETGGTWNVKVYVNETELDAITGSGAPKASAPFNMYCVDNIGVTDNYVIKFVNESPFVGEGNSMRFVFDNLAIVPYLLYTTKEANIEIGSNTYVNTDLINNTAGEGGTLTFSSAHPDIATVDENSGVVTGVAVGCTEIIATYTWPGDAGEVTTRYTVYVNRSITETFADAALVDETSTTMCEATGSLGAWEYVKIRRNASTDKLKSGVQGWWTSGQSNFSGNFLRTKEALEGGVKALSFDWMQFGSAKGAHVMLQVTVGDESPVNMVDYSVAVNGENDETDKVASKMDWNVKENAQISISNISTTTTDKQGRVVIGQIYITPYIYYTKKSAVVAVGKTYTNTSFIDNTACEGGALTYETSDGDIATVSDGVVTGVSTGEATITAKYTWDETHYVTTSYTIHVVENNALVEDFSKAPTITSEDSRKFYEGNYHTWYYRNISNNGANYILNDGTKGFWMNRKPKADKAAVSSYFETTNTAEGGIKHVSFKWHQFGNTENQTIYLSIKVNGEEKDQIEAEGGDNTADICVNDQTYESNSDVVSKSNAKLTISNVSYETGSDPKVDAQGRVIIGPISITPYLFYMQREAHMLIGERYTHPLLDNTEGEGSITYSISDASKASINSSTGEILAKASGNVTVTATWSEGANTTYKLCIAYPLADEGNNTSIIGPLNTQTVDVLLADRTIREGGYNTLCLPFDVSEEQLQATLPGAKAYEFTNAYLSGTNLDIRFNKVPALDAGKPYLVTVPADVENPVFESVTIDESTTNNIIEGENMRFIGSFNSGTMNETGLYVVANSLYRVENITSWDKTIGACRAYFDVLQGAAAVPKNIRMRIVAGTNTATGIDEVNSEELRVKKMLINGQIFIIREGKMYNAQGQAVK